MALQARARATRETIIHAAIRAAVVGMHAILGNTNDAVFTYLSGTWRIVLRGIVPARSLPYFRVFVTRMHKQYVIAVNAQAR